MNAYIERQTIKMKLNIKRVYDAADATDGKRILVDRLWPRGLTKEKAKMLLCLFRATIVNPLKKFR